MRSVKRGPTVVGEKCDDPGPRPIADWGRDTKLIAQLVAATALVAEKNVGSGRSYNLPPCPYDRTSTGNFLAKLSMPPPQTASPPQQHGYSLFFPSAGRCMSSTPNPHQEPTTPAHSVWEEGTKRHLTASTIIVPCMQPAQRPLCGTAGIALSVPRNPGMPFESVGGFVWPMRGFFHGSFG